MDASSRIALALVSLGMVAGCSDPPAPRVEVTPEETPAPEAADPPDDDPEGEPDDAPPEAPAPVAMELPETIPTPSVLRQRREERGEEGSSDYLGYPVIAHPDPAVGRVVNAAIAGVAEEMRGAGAYGGHCVAHLANEHLVSAVCDTMYDTRGGSGRVSASIHFAIAEGRVHPVTIADAFLPDTDVAAMARERCERRRAAEAEGMDEDDPERWDLEHSCDLIDLAFGPAGIVVIETDYMARTNRAEIPYADLRERIRAGGPLSPVLGGGPARFPDVAPEDADGWAVTGFGTEPALVRRWMELDPAEARGLVVDAFGGGLSRLVLPGSDAEARARRIAAALGEEARPVRLGGTAGVAVFGWDDEHVTAAQREASTLRWARTTEDLNLWQPVEGERDGRVVLAVVPEGSLVAALGGAFGQRGAYVAVVTPLGPGTLASRYLRPAEGCVIAPGPTSRHVARVSVRERGSSRDAWLVVERRGAGSHVALHARDGESCVLGDPLLAVDVERPVFDVRLGATDARGGTTLLVVGSDRARDSADMRYRVWRLGTRGPVLDESLPFDLDHADLAVRVGETVDGSYYPLTLGSGRAVRRFAYADGRLVEAPSPE